jgi:hypothetical protein
MIGDKDNFLGDLYNDFLNGRFLYSRGIYKDGVFLPFILTSPPARYFYCSITFFAIS